MNFANLFSQNCISGQFLKRISTTVGIQKLTRDGLVKIVDTGSGFQAVAIDTIVSGISMGISVTVSIRITVSVSVTIISGIQIGGISFSFGIGIGFGITAFSGTRDGLVQRIDTGSSPC